MTKTKKLTLSAMMTALAFVLTMLSKVIPSLPNGGSITLASMVPIVAVSLILGTKWGLLSGFVFSLIQMITGSVAAPPVQTVLYYALVVMLDYVLAFTVLGLGGFFYKLLKKSSFAIPLSGLIVTILRYVAHILSGILIWGVYAPEGQSVLWYSLAYNGSYMIPEIIITTLCLWLMSDFIKKKQTQFE